MDTDLNQERPPYLSPGLQARSRPRVKDQPRKLQRKADEQVRGTHHDRSRSDRVIAFIEKLTVPSGEGQGGPFKLREWQKKFIRDVYDPATETRRRLVRRAVFSVARKNGKGLALNTPIPTPSGWRTMADIQKGDLIYGSDGQPTRVSGVSDIHRGLRCWELTFSDGSKITADEEHQWITRHYFRPWDKTRRMRNGRGTCGRPRTEVVTTPQIAMSVNIESSGKIAFNHKMRIAPTLLSCNVDLPVDPYVLGAWLGDGKSNGACICAGDVDINHLLSQVRITNERAYAKRFRTAWNVNIPGGLLLKLRGLNLLNNKHIPQVYLDAGTDQRWALLQGLMDTDGSSSSSCKVPQCHFAVCSKQLASDTWRLLRSLGIKARITEKPERFRGETIGTVYNLIFNAAADQPVFRLSRKQANLPIQFASRRRLVSIVDCVEVDSVSTKCLSVDAQDKLYLAGFGCIPTHNTALIAAVALAHLVGPEAIVNGEIYSAANEREQAAIVFKMAAQFVRAEPELLAVLKVVDSTKTIVCFGNGSVYRAISAEAGSKHGFNPSVVIYDELAQAKSRALYDVLDTAMGARKEPLFLVISTQSNDPQHILSQLIDDGLNEDDPTTVTHLYQVPMEVEDIYDEAVWIQANPALGDFRSLEDMRAFADRARRMPSFEAPFRNLYLNQRTDATSPLIPRSEWSACRHDVSPLADGKRGSLLVPKERVYLGLDLSSTTDLTALVAVSADDGDRVAAWFWKPGDLLKDHEKRDHKPYPLWERQEFIEAPPGRAIDYGFVVRRIGEIANEYDVVALAFDRWRIEHILQKFNEAGITAYVEGKDTAITSGLRLIPHGQGFKDMAPAIDALETSILKREFKHDGHPVLTDNFANATVITDPAGNRKLSKSATRFRIDGAIATTMALGCKSALLQRQKKEYQLFFA